ncbi:MAG: restriction endonuclease subunit S, partial [Ruminococcus sp.]|nr:restriction endonuclease subunit S [Ruminococcus sp.]
IYGVPFKSKLFNSEKKGFPIIRIRDLKEQEFKTYTTEKLKKGYLIKNGDIVVGMDGEFKPYIWGRGQAWLNQRLCVFENLRTKGSMFLYFTIKPLLNIVEKTELATTVIHIGKKDFDNFELNLPGNDILDKFDTITYPIYQKIINNQMENQRLSALRDALLPELMNGKIDIKEV